MLRWTDYRGFEKRLMGHAKRMGAVVIVFDMVNFEVKQCCVNGYF
jgi:hypothetical protein